MDKEIRIRRLGPEDLDRLLGVDDGVFDNPILPEQATAFLSDPWHELLIAYAGAHAVGMCSATILLHPDKAPQMFINEVGVQENHRRRGIARALIERMLDIAWARDCIDVWLGTEADNRPALALYRSMRADEVHGSYFSWTGAFGAG